MEYFHFYRFLPVQFQLFLMYKKCISCKEMSSVLTLWLPIYPYVLAIRGPFLCMFRTEKKVKMFLPSTDVIKWVFVSDYLNDCIDDICHCYVTFLISWHSSLGGNFLADTLRYLSRPALSRSWHLAASGMGLGVMSHQAGCWPHCITSTSVFLSKEAIWRSPWVEGSQILSTYSVLPDWWIKFACITTIYNCCIYSIVLQMNAGFPFPLNVQTGYRITGTIDDGLMTYWE